MTRLPFKENRLSVDAGEIILLDRKYPPNAKFVAIISLVAGIYVALARLQHGGSVLSAAWEGMVAFSVVLVICRPIYYWFSHQLWVPTTLLANTDWVKGYVQGPLPAANFLTETALQLNWGDVRRATISHRPWVFATDKVELDLVLRDTGHITFRLPRLVQDERGRLTDVLREIGRRRGFEVELTPFNATPRLWRRW